MWPFSKPLDKRLLRDLNIMIVGLRDEKTNLEQALREGLSRSKWRERRQRQIVLKVAAATAGCMRDIDLLELDLRGSYNPKNPKDWTFREKQRARVRMAVLAELAAPIRQYLELLDGLPQIPGEEEPEAEKQFKAALRRVLQVAGWRDAR